MKVYCPNCKFEGKAKVVDSGCLQASMLIGLFVVGIFIWPLLLICVGLFIYFLSQGKKLQCPVCRFENPIPEAHKIQKDNEFSTTQAIAEATKGGESL